MESIINDEKQFKSVKCTHSETYSAQKKFKFLIGHRFALLKWCKSIEEDKKTTSFHLENLAFSPIMREMIDSALKNFDKPDNTNRFSGVLKDFAAYMYIMAGKASYEILAANLPIPRAKTVCELVFFNCEWPKKTYMPNQLANQSVCCDLQRYVLMSFSICLHFE